MAVTCLLLSIAASGSSLAAAKSSLAPGSYFKFSAAPPALLSVDADGRHTCGVTESHSVVCWGQDAFGEASPNALDRFRVVQGVPKANMVSTASDHSCIVSEAQQVWCWGFGAMGQLGRPYRGVDQPPRLVKGLPPMVSVDAASYATCAVTASGEVWCWGLNNYGQLGFAGQPMRWHPRRVPDLPPVRSLSLSYDHACALTTTGRAWCWGSSIYGQEGRPSRWPPIALPREVPLIVGATQVATTFAASCSVGPRAGVECWGSPMLGLASATSSRDSLVRHVPRSDGARGIWMNQGLACFESATDVLRCWGWDEQSDFLGPHEASNAAFLPTPIAVAIFSRVREVAIADSDVCVLLASNTVQCSGRV
jgi:hypothetical protein